MKTYTYKIKSVDHSFEEKFSQWIGTCRFVYNSAKELKQLSYRMGSPLTNNTIQKQLTQAKKEIDFVRVVNSQTLQAILDRLDRAYKSFYNGGGYPKWASKDKWNTIPFKSIKYRGEGKFFLPSWGDINVFLSRKFNGELRTANIKKEVDGYYLQVVTDENPNINQNDNQVSIDLGLKYFYVSSDGEYIGNPNHFKKYERQLRIEQRSLSRKKKGSNNWEKQLDRVRKTHLKIKRVRKDFLHKLSTQLAKDYNVVFCEDLSVNNMIKNPKLSKSISDCGWSMFVNMLSYKTNVVKVDPKYTSQECSECGFVSRGNRLTQSKFKCISCGYSENADFQATKNIMKRGQSLLCDNVEVVNSCVAQ